MKKIFSTMAVAAALFAGYCAYSGQNSNELSDVALANVEALADEPDSDSDGCKLTTFDCKIKISQVAFEALICDNPSLSGKYNGEKLDLTDFTLRCLKGKGNDQCMKNITCNDVGKQIGILN